MEDRIAMVCGRQVISMAGGTLRRMAEGYSGVVVDLGTGDGRWLYRVARVRPERLWVGIDANGDGLRAISRRTRRKPQRGGVPNVIFVRAAVESLPGPLAAFADVVYVQYPWGSLLRAVVHPDLEVLRRIAGLIVPRGRLHLAVNASILGDAASLARTGLPQRTWEALRQGMICSYSDVGLAIQRWAVEPVRVRSSWAGRLGQGRPVSTLVVEATRR